MNHVFSEIGPEWYVDGIPVSELKRRYEAHNGLVKALERISLPVNAGCGCSFPCRCDTPEAEEINAEAMRDIADEALAALDKTLLQPGEATAILNNMPGLRKELAPVRKAENEI